MAIFHLSVKTISRSAGRSATAAIAYRTGEKVTDQRTGVVHDYSRKRGIEHTELFLPENSPEWASDRGDLWNAAEQAETRKNSTVAREFEVAMPAELSQAERLALVREFAAELVQRHGMAVDVAIHKPGKEGDHRNHHAHILCSTRRLGPEGFTEKTRELDNQKSGEVEHWRARWAEISNRHLENAGSQERVDHRSLAAQRAVAVEQGAAEQAEALDRLPTVHMGPKVVKMEQRGIRTDRGDENRAARHYNSQVVDLAEVRASIQAAQAESAKEALAFGLVQRKLTPAILNEVLQDRQPTEAANEPTETASPNAEGVKAAWEAEKVKQFTLIVNRAREMHARTAAMVERQEAKLIRHDQAKPVEPSGLLAGFKKTTHEKALAVWGEVRAGLEKRWQQLQKRLDLVSKYLRKAAPNEQGLGKGEMLAVKKAAQARPEMAMSVRQVLEQERDAPVDDLTDKEATQAQPEPAKGVPQVVETAPSLDRVDELADYLALYLAEHARAIEWGKRLEESLEGVPQRNAERISRLKQEADALKLPGRLASNRTRLEFEERMDALKHEIGLAEAAEQKALKSLALSREIQAKPRPRVLEAIERDHPGLVKRIEPLNKDSELVQLARQRLAERANAGRKVEEFLPHFRRHASMRAIKAQGYGDQGAQWLALPASLQKMVEKFNEVPQAHRSQEISRLREIFLKSPSEANNLTIQLHPGSKKEPDINR